MAKLLDALHRLYSIKDAQAFPRLMMEVTDDLVPCVNLSFDSIELAAGAITNAFLRRLPISREEFMARWGALCHQHPGIAFLESGGHASVFTVTDFITQRQFRESALYHELFKPLGCNYQTGVILPMPGFYCARDLCRSSRVENTDSLSLSDGETGWTSRALGISSTR